MKIPSTCDPYDILLNHNLWATRELLRVARKLTPEQFAQPFKIGLAEKSGLHGLLTHIISVMGRWADRIAGKPPRLPLEPAWGGYTGAVDAKVRTPDELDAILDTNHRDLAALVPAIRADPGRVVRVDFGVAPSAFTASALLLHVLTHGHYHRAQAVNVLRQLNIADVSDKLPDLAVITWQATTDLREQP
ncbi:MAG: DinB family protein [Phycisphaeraceae bacterium]|nr:DinB family protein [Phycisphaeraceae bacterium]